MTYDDFCIHGKTIMKGIYQTGPSKSGVICTRLIGFIHSDGTVCDPSPK